MGKKVVKNIKNLEQKGPDGRGGETYIYQIDTTLTFRYTLLVTYDVKINSGNAKEFFGIFETRAEADRAEVAFKKRYGCGEKTKPIHPSKTKSVEIININVVEILWSEELGHIVNPGGLLFSNNMF